MKGTLSSPDLRVPFARVPACGPLTAQACEAILGEYMEECPHKTLVLCTSATKRLCCRHCHLTISREELEGGHCPECYEEWGVVRGDFDEVETGEGDKVRYRCEDCSVLIEVPDGCL